MFHKTSKNYIKVSLSNNTLFGKVTLKKRIACKNSFKNKNYKPAKEEKRLGISNVAI